MNTHEQKHNEQNEKTEGFPIQLKILLAVIALGLVTLAARFSGII